MIKKVIYEKTDDDINNSLMYSYYNTFINDNKKLIKEYEEFELNQIDNRLKNIKSLQDKNNIDIDNNSVTTGISCSNNDIVMICEIE